ncbi:thyrotroph embryonic factor-like [Aethina tumida]|uniref:thyrotroph embryonic factor-like n=1 Tax=Aethina tumida TaxID=116153 RepID=UPI0021485884|nr:thyrotroph embryonic factor-like [Aethina tumida]
MNSNASTFAAASLLASHPGYFPYQAAHPFHMPPLLDSVLYVGRPPIVPFHYDNQHTEQTSSTTSSPKSNNESDSGSSNLDNQESPRPFKMYNKDPAGLSMALPTETILAKNSDEAYAEFREKMKQQAKANSVNRNMRRATSSQSSDPEYLERRKRNNEAAKRSRDARKAKEDEIAIRCAFLERENLHLKIKIATLESERERLHNMMYR